MSYERRKRDQLKWFNESLKHEEISKMVVYATSYFRSENVDGKKTADGIIKQKWNT